jgi:NADH:ubiquinone oxidoreductase subunit E
MKSILEEMRLGNLSQETMLGSMSVEEKELAGYIAKHYEKLNSSLSEEQKEILEKLSDCQNEMSYLEEKELFACAFRLGARIMLEVLSDRD